MATSYMASRAASKKAEGMLAPLLESDDESSTGSDDDSDASTKVETVKQTAFQKLKSLVVFVGLGGGVALSVGSFIMAPMIAVYVMGGICIANVPYSAFKERKMLKLPSLRAMNNKLREDANHLGEEVDVLSEEIDLLEPEADRAAAVEEELREIAEQQEVNVNKLVELVKENETILAKMRDNLRQRIVQDIITIVVKSDRDNDQTIDKTEAKTLALRIRLSLQEYGVDFDSDKFLKAIGSSPSVPGVIAIVQKLLPAEKRGETNDESDSEDEDDDSEEDLYDMFHMSDDAARGSVVGRRGSVAGARQAGGLDTDEGPVSLMTCDRRKSNRRKSTIILQGLPRR